MNVKGGNSPPGKQLHHAGRNLNVVETQEVGRRPWRKERPGTWTSGNDSDIQITAPLSCISHFFFLKCSTMYSCYKK